MAIKYLNALIVLTGCPIGPETPGGPRGPVVPYYIKIFLKFVLKKFNQKLTAGPAGPGGPSLPFKPCGP